MKTSTPRILGQPSWKISSPRLEAYVTQTGGHLGPVIFDRAGRKIQPFSIAPWAQEKIDPTFPPLLHALRGDFFCLPFGGNGTRFRGEAHPPHGETANAKWKFESLQDATLHLSLRTKTRPARVDKFITLGHDHDAVYQRHVITGMSGDMSVGHHAMLRLPDIPAAGVISTSPFQFAQVLPVPFEEPQNRGYSMLKPGATFESLEQVPTTTGATTDVSRYPARRGYDDLVMLTSAVDSSLPFAWTAVTFPRDRYAWFALKDPRMLRSTILWLSNGGRHYAPWNGRHVNVLGLEEVTSYFHLGLAESSKPNALSKRGIPTTLKLNRRKPTTINYIIAVAQIPRGFDRVARITRSRDGVTLHSDFGRTARTRLDVDFVTSA